MSQALYRKWRSQTFDQVVGQEHVIQTLRNALRDAQSLPGRRPRATFPARWPVLRIDHVFLSREWCVRDVQVPRTRLTRTASDHLPLLVEVDLP